MSGTTDFNYAGNTIQFFTASSAGIYDITAYGAQGGNTTGNRAIGGDGAVISGDVTLTAGEVLKIIVGGAGAKAIRYGGGGGGGGSFVLAEGSTTTPLVVAGGGGGGGVGYRTYAGQAGGTAQSGPANGGGDGGYGGSGGGGGGLGGTGGPGSTPSQRSGGGTVGVGKYTGGYAFNAGAGGYGGGGGGGTYGGGGGGGGYVGGAGTPDGGGGGGSYFSSGGTNETTADNRTGNGEVIISLVSAAVCYLRGTRILTPTGDVAVESLKIGDLLVTRFAGIVPLRWVGRQSFSRRHVEANREKMPVCIRAGALGQKLPAADLYVSPGHSMLVGDILVLAGDLVNGVSITQDWAPDHVEYYNLDLGAHDCVIANGAYAESFADGPGLRAQFHNAAEFAHLYPAHRPADELNLCAPRPASGAKYEAVLRQIAQHNWRGLQPGAVTGYVDTIRDGWTVEGWAHDPAHPALPVVLELLLGNQLIGTTLAYLHRPDVQAAGLPAPCGFVFASPVKITPEMAATLRVRAGGQALPMFSADMEAEQMAPGLRLVA